MIQKNENLKYVFLLFAFILFNVNGDSQTSAPAPDSNDSFICELPQLPEFPGGQEAFHKYLQENIVYPDSAKKYGREGTVYVYFEVGKDGSIGNVKTKKGVPDAPELSIEAERVIRAMPNWTPGISDGETAKVGMTVPIKFVLD